VAGIFDIADDLAQTLHPADVQVTRAVGQCAGADFDDDSHIVPPLRDVLNCQRRLADKLQFVKKLPLIILSLGAEIKMVICTETFVYER
jgi:hypothetical protein